MVKIKFKALKGRNKRVQFSMPDALWTLYAANKKLAESLRADIDYSSEFEKWFTRINEQVRDELTKFSANKAVVLPKEDNSHDND
jgi:hypothetical protein